MTDSFALIADIHGNVDALRAVLADIDRRGIGCILNLGDHFSGPLAAAETADILMQREMVTIRGNHDRILIETDPQDMGASDRAAYDQLSPAHLDWLRSLPAMLHHSPEVFMCHGTPKSDTTYWTEAVSPAAEITLRPQAQIVAEAAEVSASLLLCGHTHLPRRVDLSQGRTLLNPGSVGCPGYDDDLPVYHIMETGTAAACYATVDRIGGHWASSFHHVPYDPSRMVAMAQEAGRLEWARALGSGWIRS